MAYMQVREVLQRAGTFHERLADVYRWIAERSTRDEKKRMLVYMADQEDEARRMLDDYVRTSNAQALDTWLHFIPPTTLQLGDLPRPDMDLADLVASATRLDQSLTTLYDRLATYTAAPGTQEALGQLRDLQREKGRKLSKAALLDDLV